MTDTSNMTNDKAIQALRNGKPFIHINGSGLLPPIIRTLKQCGRLRIVNTGCATVYTLKGAN